MSLVGNYFYKLNGIDSASETTRHGDQQSRRPAAADTDGEFEVPSDEKLDFLANHEVKWMLPWPTDGQPVLLYFKEHQTNRVKMHGGVKRQTKCVEKVWNWILPSVILCSWLVDNILYMVECFFGGGVFWCGKGGLSSRDVSTFFLMYSSKCFILREE